MLCYYRFQSQSHFKTGLLIFSESGSHLVYAEIFRLIAIFEKKVFKIYAVLLSFPISSFSIKVIFSKEVTLSKSKMV